MRDKQQHRLKNKSRIKKRQIVLLINYYLPLRSAFEIKNPMLIPKMKFKIFFLDIRAICFFFSSPFYIGKKWSKMYQEKDRGRFIIIK